MRRTLPKVEEILRAAGRPMRVREIIEAAGGRLPTFATKPETVVARDLALDIRDNPDSHFVRVDKGLFALREWRLASPPPEAA